MRVDLIRTAHKPDYAVWGEWYIDQKFVCFSLEPPWRGNEPDDKTTPENDASCIPPTGEAKKYKLTRRGSKMKCLAPFAGVTYEIGPVPGRTGVLVHPMNVPTQSLACIGTGMTKTKTGVGDSRTAYGMWLKAMSGVQDAEFHIFSVGEKPGWKK